MHGVLIIDKPAGCTSHDVVARVRRALGESRIGHTGTLDPLATGVLPLVIGRATRLASMLSGAAKQYEAGVRLGWATDTFDTTGEAISAPGASPAGGRVPPPGIDAAAIEAALPCFRGSYQQVPPRYSAKKIGGVAAHRRARRNEEVEMKPAAVTVSALELLGYADGLAQLRVTASAGFYVRSLAHDLGQTLGCGGHMETLRRTRAGAFSLADAVPLDEVERDGTACASRLIPMDRLLLDVPAVRLTEAGVTKVRHGNTVGPAELLEAAAVAEVSAGARVRLLDAGGRLLGIAEPVPHGLLHPAVVLM